MAFCPPPCGLPSCAIPSSSPQFGLGPAGSLGGLGLGGRISSGALLGRPTSSGELGTLSGVIPSGINQIPPAEIIFRSPPVIVTIPGPILSASCDPVAVWGNTPCALSGSGPLGQGLLGGRGLLGKRGGICLSPCSF